MNWKEFLRSDWRKIVLFAIILLIGFFIPILPVYCDVSPFAGVCAPGTICTFNWYGLIRISELFENYGTRNYCGIVTYDSNMFYLSLIVIVVDVIFYFIISCLIVWIYDKVKKK